MDFASDNTVGASPRVLDAIVAANQGAVQAYGHDPYSDRARALLNDVFECDVTAFFVATGTASNALALGAVTPPWGAVFCHHQAHIANDECGAPEMFTSGAKLIGVDGAHGKIDPAALRSILPEFPTGVVRQVQPASLSLSQATECGTLYDCSEIAELAAIAHGNDMAVHMDGARFANALVALGCTPAEMSWKSGIDVLSFGATKNGTLACEAVIFFDKAKAATFAYQCKRAGHILSKGRMVGAQMAAYLANGHWLDLARLANQRATELSDDLAKIPGVQLAFEPRSNQLFAVLPRAIDAALKKAGARYYEWGSRGFELPQPLGPDEVLIRLVTSFATPADDVRDFVSAAREAAQLRDAKRPLHLL
jgi:threonine aldolase